MQNVVGIIGAIIIFGIPIYANWGAFWSSIAPFVWMCILGFVIYLAFAWGKPALEAWDDYQGRLFQKKKEQAEREEAHRKEQERLADLRELPPYPTPEALTTLLKQRYLATHDVVLHAPYLDQIIEGMGLVYEKEFKPPKMLPSAEAGLLPLQRVFAMFEKGLRDATKAANPLLLEPTGYVFPPTAMYTEELPPQNQWELAKALRDTGKNQPYFDVSKYNITGGTWRPEPPDLRGEERAEANRMQKAYEKKLKEFQKFEKRMEELHSLEQRHLSHTPYWPYWEKFVWQKPIKKVYTFKRDHRFRHALMVGGSGAGKTTFLSYFIREALEKVKQDKASIFLMDSQNQLIPWIAKSKMFAPGGELHGKLVYLEPSKEWPLALNIFDFNAKHLQGLSGDDLDAALRESAEMVKFFVESLVKTEASGFVDGIINYTMRAMEKIPGASIVHLIRLLDKGEFNKMLVDYPRLAELDEDDTRFLLKDMFEGNYAASLGSMKSRLYVFRSDKLFMSMFRQKNQFDLFTLLGSSKVVLINTMEARLKASKEPFGRFFIGKLLQATQHRGLPREDGSEQDHQEVYAFVDEAQDYLKHHGGFTELQQKARKQNVALTIATHDLAEFDPNVQASLKKLAIQAWGLQEPIWHVAVPSNIPDAPPAIVHVPNATFKNELKMTEAQWNAIIAQMREDYANPAPSGPAQTPSSSLRSSPQLSAADEFPTGPTKY